MNYLFTTILFCLTCCWSSLILSQTDTTIGQQVELRTTDGNTYVGEILSMTETEIVLKTSVLGDITLDRATVNKVIYRNSEQELNKKGCPVDYHNSTHYLINPSGYALEKGQSYYENIGVFFNSYSVGITNNFTISGGLELISPLFLQRVPSLYISPKLSFNIGERAGAFSVGSTVLAAFGDGEVFSVGVVQAALTVGSRNNNFTVGTGIGYTFDDDFGDGVLPFYLSGMWRLSNKVSFVTDNFIFTYDNFDGVFGLLSAAVRIHFAKNGSAFNAGLWRPTEDTGPVLALPFVSATIAIN